MREILFRGKRDDDGEWMFGNLTLWGDGTASINETPAEGSPLYAVDPDSIGQFTGLTDRNGTPIFEGDIFRAKEFCLVGIPYNAHNYEVIFKNGGFLLNKIKGPYMALAAWNKMGEVIGNIHDNPELMKGGELK